MDEIINFKVSDMEYANILRVEILVKPGPQAQKAIDLCLRDWGFEPVPGKTDVFMNQGSLGDAKPTKPGVILTILGELDWNK